MAGVIAGAAICRPQFTASHSKGRTPDGRPYGHAGNTQERNAWLRALRDVVDLFFVGDDARIVPTFGNMPAYGQIHQAGT